jgi:hypothetical protein
VSRSDKLDHGSVWTLFVVGLGVHCFLVGHRSDAFYKVVKGAFLRLVSRGCHPRSLSIVATLALRR